MPLWLVSFALKSWGFLKGAFTWLFSDIRHLLIAALALVALWGWHEHNGKLECQRNDAAYRASVKQASAANAAAQAKLIADQKVKFDTAAEKANATYEAQLAVARTAADRYKLSHRVQPGTSGIGTPATAGEGDAAEPAENAPTGSELVAVTSQSFDACTVDYTYAKQVYDWAQDLIGKGAAEFSPN